MTSLKARSFYFKVYSLLPIIFLFVSVLNEFDFNYLNLKYFSFNFPFILIYYWSLKRSGSLGYGLIFLCGLLNDVVTGLPIGVSSLAYLLICVFSSYLRNITLRPNAIKDWFFFGLAILVVNSLFYLIVGLVFDVELDYYSILVNILFTFLFYIIFSGLFDYYQKIIFGAQNV